MEDPLKLKKCGTDGCETSANTEGDFRRFEAFAYSGASWRKVAPTPVSGGY